MSSQDSLQSLSPLDGKYLFKTSPLRPYFSTSALTKYRILVELLYMIELVDFLGVAKISKVEKDSLLKWQSKLDLKDCKKVIGIEQEIKHDVKAIEYFIRQNLAKLKLKKLSSWIHWGLTSNDTNNLAYALMVQNAKDNIFLPSQLKIIKFLIKMAEDYKNVVLPARTHGQIAVPTTLGKELLVFASRASFFLEKINKLRLGGKLNGAAGNFNAQVQIYPQKNWPLFSHNFVKKLGLEPSFLTTQIEPYTRTVYLFDLVRQLNNVWLDLAKDCWLYISYDYLVQKTVKKEVGSSTMPHKVNPINFENAEGNLELANSLFAFFSNKLSISRLQRDLSDSTVRRNFGSAFGHTLLATDSLLKGLAGIKPNNSYLKKELSKHPEMLSEALQLALKTWGKPDAYEHIKQKTRGSKLSWEEMISSFTAKEKKKLASWKPESYIGLAPQLVDKEIKRIKKILKL